MNTEHITFINTNDFTFADGIMFYQGMQVTIDQFNLEEDPDLKEWLERKIKESTR